MTRATATFFILACTLAASCSKESGTPQGPGRITISINADPVKGFGKNDFETRISGAVCLLFKDDILQRQLSLSDSGKVSFDGLVAGNYRAVVLTGDCPTVGTGTSYEDLITGQYYVYAEGNGYSSGFPMFAQKSLKLSLSEKLSEQLTLSHCCARLDIQSLDFDYSGALSSLDVENITLEEVFIMNAPSACHVDGTAAAGDEWGENGVGCFNLWDGSAMTMTSDEARLDATFYSYEGEFKPLYICPTLEKDAPSTSFLVLKTRVAFTREESSVWYYRIRLDSYGREISANHEYSFCLSISGPGADSPDKDSPGTIFNTVWEAGDTENGTF